MHLWRQRDYVLWLIGDTAGTLSSSMRVFAVPLATFYVTHSATAAGFITGLTSITFAVLSLPGGVVIDAHDRRQMIMTYAVSGMALHGVFGVLLLTGHTPIQVLIAYAILSGARAGLLGNTTNVALKSVVSDDSLTEAFGANQARDEIVSLLSGPFAGLMFAISPALPFFVELLGAATLAVSFMFIRAPLAAQNDEAAKSADSPFADLLDGLRWVAHNPVVRRLISVSFPLTLGMTGIESAVIIHLQAIGTPTGTVGLVSAGAGLGALVGALSTSVIARRFPTGWTMICGSLLMCFCYIPIAFVSHIPLIIASIGCAAACIAVVNAQFGSYFMHIVPDNILGRALAVSSLVGMGSGGLGSMLAGFGLGSFDFRLTIVGLLAVLATAVPLLLSSSHLRAVPLPAQWSTAELTQAAAS
ncbi:MFS transporter [Actinomyces succiniciruminis]|uniref:Major facilitator super MFS 1 transporter n=1 Tax=Actinomyces succiniciruminis TaxID=1522002 RepID=A0A1L7REL3_9ACTO|nr:MFS transporter [Actinomyces succiniciruminis]CED92525.1 Major facilitator super MFS 1 transporter [Actinomyces succiniciruminis]